MSETPQAYAWAIATMQADSALVAASEGGIWQGNADIATLDPYVYVGRQGGGDALTMNVVRIFTDILLQIKAVGPAANYAALVTIAGRIDALFGRASHIALASGGVLACWREQEIEYNEMVNGVQWNHVGGLYHVQLQGV